jgi:hypothetical protein
VSARKSLTTRPLEQDTLLVSMQREVIPYLRQTGELVDKLVALEAPIITGSRSADTVAILGRLLALLARARVIKNETTP